MSNISCLGYSFFLAYRVLVILVCRNDQSVSVWSHVGKPVVCGVLMISPLCHTLNLYPSMVPVLSKTLLATSLQGIVSCILTCSTQICKLLIIQPKSKLKLFTPKYKAQLLDYITSFYCFRLANKIILGQRSYIVTDSFSLSVTSYNAALISYGITQIRHRSRNVLIGSKRLRLLLLPPLSSWFVLKDLKPETWGMSCHGIVGVLTCSRPLATFKRAASCCIVCLTIVNLNHNLPSQHSR